MIGFEVSLPFLSVFLQGLMSVADDTLDGSRSRGLFTCNARGSLGGGHVGDLWLESAPQGSDSGTSVCSAAALGDGASQEVIMSQRLSSRMGMERCLCLENRLSQSDSRPLLLACSSL